MSTKSSVPTSTNYIYVQSPIYTCPGGAGYLYPGTEYASFTPPGGGTVVSVGFQNFGNAMQLSATQIFIQNNTTAFVQVSNASVTSTQWCIWCVIDTTSASTDYVTTVSSELTCSGHSSQYNNLSVNSGTMVSIGIQNIGMAINFYTSQMFVQTKSNAFVQVANNAFTATDYYLYGVANVNPSKTYALICSPMYSCSAMSTQYNVFKPGTGTVVSVGIQNIGDATNLSASQIFAMSASSVYAQVYNDSLTSTDWYIWCVVDTSA
jgi:hypothetical protein